MCDTNDFPSFSDVEGSHMGSALGRENIQIFWQYCIFLLEVSQLSETSILCWPCEKTAVIVFRVKGIAWDIQPLFGEIIKQLVLRAAKLPLAVYVIRLILP